MADFTKITRVLRGTSAIIGDLILLAEVIHSWQKKQTTTPVEATIKPEKVPAQYNEHHHYSKRKAKSLMQKVKDEELRDFIMKGNAQWANSKMKSRTMEKIEDDPFE